MRVVSLVPSVTETLLAWGVVPVACTRFCEQPSLPHVGGTKDPDIAAIVALQPDLVVVDREENRLPDADALRAAGVPLHVLHVHGLLGLDAAMTALASAVGAPPAPIDPGPPEPTWGTAVALIWRRPWMALGADTYGAELLAHLGLRPALHVDAGRYPETDLPELAAAAPDVVLLPSEPYPFTERHVPEVQAAMPSAEVLTVDGRDLLWWGARTPGAVARLREVTAGLRARPRPW